MTGSTQPALFRVRSPSGAVRFALGTADGGPERYLHPGVTLRDLLAGAGHDRGVAAAHSVGDERVPRGVALLAPVDEQEVWCAGVTYLRSRDARTVESAAGDVYQRVYGAARPELFFKAPAWRVVGPGADVGIRADSPWNVPEPELGLVIGSDGAIVGLTIGNDMSSRSIEGENPLYLPQAKIFDRSCAIGPCIVFLSDLAEFRAIHLTIERQGTVAFAGQTSTQQIARPFVELAAYLTRALDFPAGAILLTGTGIVPPDDFTLAPGDEIEVSVDGLGTLRNRVVTVGDAHVASGAGHDR